MKKKAKKEITNEDIAMYLAERAVTIQEGEKVGRWTRQERIMLVYSVILSLFRNSKNEK